MNNEFAFEKLGALKINLLDLYVGIILIMLWETLYLLFTLFVLYITLFYDAPNCVNLLSICAVPKTCVRMSAQSLLPSMNLPPAGKYRGTVSVASATTQTLPGCFGKQD